jgi:hypothetical protein
MLLEQSLLLKLSNWEVIVMKCVHHSIFSKCIDLEDIQYFINQQEFYLD